MIEISASSHYENFTHYDVIIMCGGFNDASEKLYVVSSQKAEGKSIAYLEAESADKIEAIIYVVPRMLPEGKNEPINNHPPFDAEVRISNGKTQIYSQVHKINAWGGAAIKLNLDLNN